MKLTPLATLALVCAVVIPASAQTLDVPATPSTIPGGLPSRGDSLSLDLHAAYELALARNLNLQVGRYQLAAAGTDILAGSGAFDPQLGLSVGLDSRESPASSELEGADVTATDHTDFGLSLSQLLPSGTQLSLTTGATRTGTNSDFVFLNPNWGADATARLKQPLLQGFGTLANRSQIVIARNSRDQSAYGFELSVVDTLRQVEEAYWNLIAARATISVREQSLELAGRLLDETQERVKVGTSAPIDMVQSQAGVASRREEVIAARNAAGNAEDTLKAVLGFDQPQEWLMPIDATEDYEVEPVAVDLAQAIETALAQRPELSQQQLAIDLAEHNLKVARNGTLPTLDLDASYGYSGVGGRGEYTDPDLGLIRVDTGLSDAYRQVTKFDYPHWEVGLTFGMPLGNTEAKATVARNRFVKAQRETELRGLQQQIIREVRVAVRALADSAAAIEAATASVDFANRNLEAEQTKFENGLSTNYQVLQIQNDLADARLSLINAYLSYHRSQVAYRVALGTLLEDYDVTIVDPGAPEAKYDYWDDVKWLQFVTLGEAADQVTNPAEPAGTGS